LGCKGICDRLDDAVAVAEAEIVVWKYFVAILFFWSHKIWYGFTSAKMGNDGICCEDAMCCAMKMWPIYLPQTADSKLHFLIHLGYLCRQIFFATHLQKTTLMGYEYSFWGWSKIFSASRCQPPQKKIDHPEIPTPVSLLTSYIHDPCQ
jgi:hypothetical protein